MKNRLIVLTMAMIFSLAGYVYAHEGMEHDEGMEMMDHEKGAMMGHEGMMMKQSSNAKNEMHVATQEDIKNLPNVGNKFCPISKNKVDDGSMGEAVKFVYNGKIYNLCCSMCVKDFKKNPGKYSKIAEDEVKEHGDEDEGHDNDHTEEDGHHHEHGHDHDK